MYILDFGHCIFCTLPWASNDNKRSTYYIVQICNNYHRWCIIIFCLIFRIKSLPSATNHNQKVNHRQKRNGNDLCDFWQGHRVQYSVSQTQICMTHRGATIITLLLLHIDISSDLDLGNASLSPSHHGLSFDTDLCHIAYYRKCSSSVSWCILMRLDHNVTYYGHDTHILFW